MSRIGSFLCALRGRLRWHCLLLLLYAPAGWAATYALLVGVSAYPNLPASKRLEGPANDVRLMEATLQRVGVPGDQIIVLADGLPQLRALPTRDNIFNYANVLVGRLRPGDWIVLQFSGHGSQQPQFAVANGYREPDGLDEVFLPRDAMHWDGQTRRIGNGITDDEIGALLDRINARGANVWAIFDTCHAGDMTKNLVLGRDHPVARYVSPAELGVPADLLAQARNAAARAGSAKSLSVHSARAGRMATSTSIDVPQRVAFFASQPDEPAYEESLASDSADSTVPARRRIGVFTFHLVATMTETRTTFRELANQVRLRYRNEKRPFPTPMFEGELDRRMPIR